MIRPIKNILQSTHIVALLLLCVACQPNMSREESTDTQYIQLSHPLVGKIWSVSQKRFVTEQYLAAQIIKHQYVLLGETHDNKVHHQGQAWALDLLLKNKKKIGVAFEMIDDKQAERLKDANPSTVDAFIDILNQQKEGWKYRQYYADLFRLALHKKVQIFPANINREDLIEITKQGIDKVPARIQAVLDANRLGPADKKTMTKEITDAHCGFGHKGMIKAMMLGQRVRDATMALTMLEKNDNDVMVLIAGSGHVRNDRGVPAYIKRQDNNSAIISISWVEVIEDRDTAAPYAERWSSDNVPFDYIWFTPQLDRPDPCESFRKHMRKKKENESPKLNET